MSDLDQLEAQIEKLSSSFFFDLDANFDMAQTLVRRKKFVVVPKPETSTSSFPFPTNFYMPEPMALYLYGRTSPGLPLVEFLAYYQCLEFFFPIYANKEAVTRLRSQIANPRFRLFEDDSLIRAIASITHLTSHRSTERELLRLVLRVACTEESIRTFIESNSALQDHFCAKNQSLSGVDRILLGNGAEDLRDQVARRIYQIRCRIVHTKSDGGDDAIDLLLPTSKEVRSLSPDLAIVRLLAKQVLIANAQPLF
jgi:hypothetical protein